MTTKRTIAVAAGTVAATLLLGAATVLGQANFIDRVYPASGCTVWSGPAPSYFYSGIENHSSSAIWVDCPVVNETGNPNIGYVQVRDRHPSSAVECTFFSAWGNGSGNITFWATAPQASGGSTNRFVSLIFDSIVDPDPSRASFYYSCTIPPAYSGRYSAIHSYRLEERE